jgi:hypothetical protein
MFVVGTALRRQNGDTFTPYWPVVHENPDTGLSTAPVNEGADRESAQKIADALNAAATLAPPPVPPTPPPTTVT